ncbi:hypothetical protein [Streptomyces sp. NPDC091215]|uniref:hypothetical protein n=1 Tax=Streptomyces sp. NPDC091215 TaxID=3155192 RepID=UPI0034168F33
MAIYQDDVWEDRDADGYALSPSVTLLKTPGHTAEDISTLVTTNQGLVVLTHLWRGADGPADDPFASDCERLSTSREQVLALGPSLIVPGHGESFVPGSSTPLWTGLCAGPGHRRALINYMAVDAQGSDM